MKASTEMGKNMTGVDMSPFDSADLIEFAAAGSVSDGSEKVLEEEREDFAREAGAVGTVPPPASIRGVAATAVDALKGARASTLVDKLGERLAFERTGSRLYEALLAKFDASEKDLGIARSRLVEIRDDEVRHMALLEDAIRSIGADPTVMTPCADLAGVEAAGIVQVVTDPRTSLAQCLNAMLIAELTDREAWTMLASLVAAFGHDEMAEQFRHALAEEASHLDDLRSWNDRALSADADVDLAAPAPPPA